ncbi:MAG: aminoglycoside phosphotransferase family protein [Acidobacteriota bacterium]
MALTAPMIPPKEGTLRASPPGGPVPDDCRLPGLAAALEPLSMRRRLEELFGVAVEHLAISYVRYKPGLSCIIQYVAQGGGERIFHGRVCRPDEFSPMAAKAYAVHRPRPGLPRPVAASSDLGLVLVAFPEDRAIPGMRHILDTDKLKRVLHEQVPRFAGGNTWVSGSRSEVEVVSYKPERSCLVRCRLGVKNRETGELARETIFARAYASRVGAAVHALLERLQSGPDRNLARCVPGSLGHDRDRRLLFMQAVPGETVLSAAAGERRRWMFEAGRFLARLHGVAGHTAGAVEPLEQAVDVIAALRQVGLTEARALADAAARLAHRRPVARSSSACLHGDFHPEQLLVGPEGLRCVDFDASSNGDPGIDVGYFLAHLRRLARLEVWPSDEDTAGSFLQGYDETGPALPVQVTSWHRDVTFLRMALNSIKHLEQDWPATVEDCLAEIGA